MAPTIIDCHGETISIRRTPSDFGDSIRAASRCDMTALVSGKASRVLSKPLAGDTRYSRTVRSAIEASRTYQRSHSVETSVARSTRRMGKTELAKAVGGSARNSLSDSILKNVTNLAGAEVLSPTARKQVDRISGSALIRGAGRPSVFGLTSIRSSEPWNQGVRSAFDVSMNRRIDPNAFEAFTSAGRLAKAKASVDALASQFKLTPQDVARLQEQWGLRPGGHLARAMRIVEKHANRTLLAQAKAMGFDDRHGSLQSILGRQFLEASQIGGVQSLGIGVNRTTFDWNFGVPRAAKLATPLGRSWSERVEPWIPSDGDFEDPVLPEEVPWLDLESVAQAWHRGCVAVANAIMLVDPRYVRWFAIKSFEASFVPVIQTTEQAYGLLFLVALIDLASLRVKTSRNSS